MEVRKGSVIEKSRKDWYCKTWHTGNGQPGWDQIISFIYFHCRYFYWGSICHLFLWFSRVTVTVTRQIIKKMFLGKFCIWVGYLLLKNIPKIAFLVSKYWCDPMVCDCCHDFTFTKDHKGPWLRSLQCLGKLLSTTKFISLVSEKHKLENVVRGSWLPALAWILS